VWVAAARAGWSGFLGDPPLRTMGPMVAAWRERIRDLLPPARFLVATDATRVVGFAWVRRTPDIDVPGEYAELAALYTHPEAQRRGIGRVLLRRVALSARASGMPELLIWTEERNTGPRRAYEAAGARLDGTVRERVWQDVPIRELRYRLRLAPFP
jgi:GNAT superfamily N-acetyltransferase